jgi:hypothetical protein
LPGLSSREVIIDQTFQEDAEQQALIMFSVFIKQIISLCQSQPCLQNRVQHGAIIIELKQTLDQQLRQVRVDMQHQHK